MHDALKQTATAAFILLLWGLLSGPAVAGQDGAKQEQALDSDWVEFEHAERFELSREALKAQWSALHKRDLEPFPDTARILAVADDLGESPDDPQAIARAMQDAWRAYHAGRFHASYRMAKAQGPYGYYLTQRSWIAYTATLAPEDQEMALIEAAVERLDKAPQTPSRVRINDYWVQGLILGQYSRRLSSSKARAEDIPERVARIVDWTLSHAPKHAQAHINRGSYHAEIIDRVGWMLAKLTYGANAEKAVEAYRRGLGLAPRMAVGYGEAAMGLHKIDAAEYRDLIEAYTDRLEDLEPLDAEDYLEKRRRLRLLEQGE